MRGKAPSNENKSSQDYVHVDVGENWLETHVTPATPFIGSPTTPGASPN